MSVLAFALNFDTLGVLQSLTIFAQDLPPLATITLSVSGTALPTKKTVVLGSVTTDATGAVNQTTLLPNNLQFSNLFYQGATYINIPQGIRKGDSFSVEVNVGDPNNDVKTTVSVS